MRDCGCCGGTAGHRRHRHVGVQGTTGRKKAQEQEVEVRGLRTAESPSHRSSPVLIVRRGGGGGYLIRSTRGKLLALRLLSLCPLVLSLLRVGRGRGQTGRQQRPVREAAKQREGGTSQVSRRSYLRSSIVLF